MKIKFSLLLLLSLLLTLFVTGASANALPEVSDALTKYDTPAGTPDGTPAARAQATVPHQAIFTWELPSDATAAATYTILRASGACPAVGLGSLTFVKVNATPIVGQTFTDTPLAVGVYCWYVTHSESGAESGPSNTAGGSVRPNTVTIQLVLK